MSSRISLLIIAALLLTGCVTPPPPYVEPEGPGALLQNRLEERGQARFFFFFEYAGRENLSPRGINFAADPSPAIYKTNSPYDSVYKIPPGRTVVGVRVVYTPAYGRNIFARGNDRYYHLFVRNLGFAGNKSMTDAENENFSGLQGLSFEALEGHTYRVNARIENGRGHIWIEELDGNIVSETKLGFTTPVYYAGERLPLEDYGLVSPLIRDVPDPTRQGWIFAENLPDPRE
jgi:hypothetical protein